VQLRWCALATGLALLSGCGSRHAVSAPPPPPRSDSSHPSSPVRVTPVEPGQALTADEMQRLADERDAMIRRSTPLGEENPAPISGR